MATSDALAIDRLGPDDVAAGLALSDAAGWNQSLDDWAFFMTHGEVFGARDEAGQVVATSAALPYEGGFGWISMVLVDVAHRHRGLAGSLLDACVAALRRAGRVPVLDATPEGAEVYRKSGFVAGFAFERWERADTGAANVVAPRRRGAADAPFEARRDADVDELVALDAAAQRVGRALLLRAFVARAGTRAWLAATRDGFVIARSGRRATQIGPVVAARTADALSLLETALASTAGRVFIDVPARAATLAQRLEQRGFVRQRPFVRMALGDSRLLSADLRMFALAGPEFG
jgi:GNAT superfamily N-acetyltransferase